MPESERPAKAHLIELDKDMNVKGGGKDVIVQFNPETLKLSFANQVTPSGNGDQAGTAGKQFVGTGSTKLSVQLWFDVTSQLPEGKKGIDDVRALTQEVVYFISTQKDKDPPVPPAVRFSWGTFIFDGVMDSIEETIEFFSSEGKPLRSTVSVSLSQQKILTFAGNARGQSPGTRPLAQAAAGASLQGMAASAGLGSNWQAIASANGIENPRLLSPGQLIDLNSTISISLK
jgi:hypothetical protein